MTAAATEKWKNLSWHELAKLPEQERVDALLSRLNTLAKLPQDQRKIDLEAMALVTADLPNDEAVAVMRSYFRACSRMNPHEAEVVAASYEIAMGNTQSDIAWKQITLAQQVTKHLSPEEQHKLHLLFPQGVPEALTSTVSPSPEQNELPAEKLRKRTWWPFSHRKTTDAL